MTFEIIAKDHYSDARAGIIHTKHGNIETPYLIPVATCGSVRALTSEILNELNTQCILANTYHLHFQPGDKLIKKNFQGLHNFMNWHKPIFTDSGGFQAFSLGLGITHGVKKIGFIPNKKHSNNEKKEILAKITDEGIEFRSTYDGSISFINPKISMEIQSNLGSDIIMAFDECTSQRSNKKYIEKAMHRTHKWALESIKYHDKNQAIYGIIQGGFFKDLRQTSAKFILQQKFDGIAIGGSLGEKKSDILKVMSWLNPYLKDDERARHMLGIGWIDDLFNLVEQGIDTFDCIEMTRIARHGNLYVSPPLGNKKNKFRIDINKSIFKNNPSPIDPYCKCPVCKKYSKAYIHHLFKSKELSYHTLASIHNVYFILSLTKQIRASIINSTFQKLKKQWLR